MHLFLFLLACAPEAPGSAKDAVRDTGADETGADDTAPPDPPPSDQDGDGYDALEDCNDASALIYPGALEACDGLDNDCDGLVDGEDPDVSGTTTWYRDEDLDTFGAEPTSGCGPAPTGYAEREGDCDDGDPTVNPLGVEACDGVDNDCDGLVDADDPDGPPLQSWYADDDADSYGAGVATVDCADPTGARSALQPGDCDDGNPAIHPDAAEVCNDGVDDDCDGTADAGDPSVTDALTVYADGDNDGYASDDALAELACTPPEGYAEQLGDCDDADPEVSPAADEVCDRGVDNDCDGFEDGQDAGVVDATTWYRDSDGDGFGDPATTRQACNEADGWAANADDCNDQDATVTTC